MDETRLTLLMTDGLVAVIFQGALTPSQYADLHAAVNGSMTIATLKEKVAGLAQAWGLTVSVERVANPKLN